MSIRIVSLNCWGGRVHEPLLDFLQNVDADILCLQEMYYAPPDVPSPLIFNYKHRPTESPLAYPSLFTNIRAILWNHQAFFYPTAQGYLNDGITTEYKVRYGLATFIRNSLPIIGEGIRFVHGTYRSAVFGDSPLPRNAHCVRLWRYDHNKPLVIAHMHGLWLPIGKGDAPERKSQATALADLVKSVMQQDDDIVVCGDFNVLPDSITFDILGNLGLRDLVVTSGYTDTRTSYYKKDPRYADYMLVSTGLQVLNFDVPTEPEVSDHRPLVLDCM